MTRTVRLRHLAEVNPSTAEFDRLPDDAEVAFMPLETVWANGNADFTRRRPKAEVSIGYTRFRTGDILVPKVTPTFQAARVAIADIATAAGAGTTELHILRARAGVDPRFVGYVCRSKPFLTEGISAFQGVAGLQRVPEEFVKNFPVADLSLDDQRRIADFLDAETSRIDEMRGLRSTSLDLLQERRIAGVDRRVRGADQADLIEAEYEALGHVPRAWTQARLRSVDCDVQTGPFGSQLHAVDYVDNCWPVINPANIGPTRIVPDLTMTVDDITKARLNRHILQIGDVIFGRRGEIGRAAVVTNREAGWLCGTGALRVRFREDSLLPGYLHRYLGIPAVRYYFEDQAVGSTMANLNSAILRGMPLLIPSALEQREVSDACDQVDESTDRAIAAIRRQVDVLSEHRQALITAAVTGQLDVTTAGRATADLG